MKQLIFLLIIIFIFLIISQIIDSYKSKNIQIKQEFDIIIIGTGTTGAYLSNRLAKQFPEKK
jgi:ribulose 1,5-bisphosphate synthetase/thiazole synthase